ncbi:MAG TPA: pyridoxamine 5'-phosphate oxidase family protein [Candidatus Binataceae bacterium]|jgi:PPOX class probable F420-dependent enzyme|nr:pyridoxamine 5'-phosphate oxidase family protein [Candidatus Binataceae bacterium]
MNRRQQIALTTDEVNEFLAQPHKASLATIDKDGFPHVVAMGYLFRDGALYMTSYGKAQKVLNIRRNPKVGVMVETGNAYANFRGVMIRGTCEIIEDRETVARMMRGMAGSQPSENSPPKEAINSAPKRVLLKITPLKISSWDHSKLGGRY